MTVKMPYQCFINGQFTDADDGKTYDTISPTDGSVSNHLLCTVTTGHGFLFYSAQLENRQSASEHLVLNVLQAFLSTIQLRYWLLLTIVTYFIE